MRWVMCQSTAMTSRRKAQNCPPPRLRSPARQGCGTPAAAMTADGSGCRGRSCCGCGGGFAGVDNSHCKIFPIAILRRGARNLVFGRGTAGARVMILEDAPGRAEDLQGLPFAGPTGQLLDKMCAAIGLNWARGGLYSLGHSLASAARPRGQRGGNRNDAAVLASSYHLSRATGCHLHGQHQLSGDFGQRRPEQAAWCMARGICAAGLADGASAGLAAPACAEETGMARFVDAQSLAQQAIRRRHEMTDAPTKNDFVAVRIAVLTVSDSRSLKR